MDIDKLKKRIEELEKSRSEMLANYQAICGAIQDCQYWIDVIQGVKNASE